MLLRNKPCAKGMLQGSVCMPAFLPLVVNRNTKRLAKFFKNVWIDIHGEIHPLVPVEKNMPKALYKNCELIHGLKDIS